MGNYRFRFKLSDMMPNAWFFKLRDMAKSRNHAQNYSTKRKNSDSSKQNLSLQIHPRKSYYFTRELITNTDGFRNSPANPKSPHEIHFPEAPRNSSKQRTRRRKSTSTYSPRLVTSSVSSGCSCRTKFDSPPEFSSSSPCDNTSPEPEIRTDRVLTTESFVDVDQKSLDNKLDEKPDEFDSLYELELPPIITKPPKLNEMLNEVKKNDQPKQPKKKSSNASSLSVKIVKEDDNQKADTNNNNHPMRKVSVNSPGMRIRINNSPRIASRKMNNGRKIVSSTGKTTSRRSLLDSFAIMKSSYDPQRDFRESMVEMIVENNIRAAKELEDLLACYLSLNSDEYHSLIIKVFKQIWFDLTEITTK